MTAFLSWLFLTPYYQMTLLHSVVIISLFFVVWLIFVSISEYFGW